MANYSAAVRRFIADRLSFLSSDGCGNASQWVGLETLETRVLLSASTLIEPVVPNDPRHGEDGMADNIDLERAWGITTGSNEVVVVVMDTGVDINHPDLAGNIWLNPFETENGEDDSGNGFVDDIRGWNFQDNNNDVSDLDGHGTHVAGTVGAVGNNAVGMVGVNWEVKLLPIKLDFEAPTLEGFFDSAIAGLNYVIDLKQRGVNIVAITASWGARNVFPFPQQFSNTVARAGENDILFIPAAGNAAEDVDRIHDFPTKFALSLPNVIAVAATNRSDQLAGFSNFGPATVHVAAPGVDILSTVPLDLFGVEYEEFSGTSMAAPVVAGIAALVKAARPEATATEIRQAIFDGVDVISSLQPLPQLPPLVTTGGRVNAYKAIRNIQERLVGRDTGTQGNWQGAYGSQGVFIVGDSTALPEGITVTGANEWIIQPQARDARGLQRIDSSGRVVGYLQARREMWIDLDFEDEQARRVMLYMVDVDSRRTPRTQRIEIWDQATNQMLSAQEVNDFRQGQYLTFDLTEGARIRIVNTGGGSHAVISGIFLDEPATADQILIGTDTATMGNWRGTFGSTGAFVAGDSSAFPAFADVEVEGATVVSARPPAAPRNAALAALARTHSPFGAQAIAALTQPRPAAVRTPQALERVTDATRRADSYWSAPETMTIRVDLQGEQPRLVSLYMADLDSPRNDPRSQIVEVIDPDTGNVLSRHHVNNFRQGQYLTWEFEGSRDIRITRIAGPSAAASGIFFDTPAGQNFRFVGTDDSTRGNWRGVYGADWKFIVGESTMFPPFAEVELENVTNRVVASQTNDRRALQRETIVENRVVGYWLTRSSMTIDLDFADNRMHRVGLYAVDFENLGRTQRIEIIDPATGQVMSRVDMNDFRNGQYVFWDLAGHVQIRVINTGGGPDAVVSGIFFD